MATDPTPHLVNWRYNDWRQKATAAEQLKRLQLHIQEVEGFVLESQSKGRSMKLQEKYLDRLEEHIARLERQVMFGRMGARFGQVSTFERGTGA